MDMFGSVSSVPKGQLESPQPQHLKCSLASQCSGDSIVAETYLWVAHNPWHPYINPPTNPSIHPLTLEFASLHIQGVHHRLGD